MPAPACTYARPFRTTAVKGLPRYEYDTVNRGWVPVTG